MGDLVRFKNEVRRAFRNYYYQQIIKCIRRLEFHEVITLCMMLFIFLIYTVNLKALSLECIKHFVLQGSPITKLFMILLIMLGIISRLIPNMKLKQFSWFLFRIMSAFLIMLLSFESITYFIDARDMPLKDAMLQHLDAMIFFGKQPAVWLEAINSTPLTLMLSVAYLSWFIFLYGTVFLLLYKGKKPVLQYTTIALLTFYIGYILYIFFPGIGPLYTYNFSTQLGGLTQILLTGKLIKPAADVFPSLHTAISIVMLVEIWRSFRIWTWLYAPMTILIIFSTIYLRIHYGVDVIAGILLALVTTHFSPKIMWKWENFREFGVNGDSKVFPKAPFPLSGHLVSYKEMLS